MFLNVRLLLIAFREANTPMTSEELEAFRTKRYNGTVTYLHKTHSDLMIVRVRPDFPRPNHKPGQYCTLGLGNWEPRVEGCQVESLPPDALSKLVRRAYSLSCSIESQPGVLYDPLQTDWVEFYIVLVRENTDGRVPALTPRLFNLKVGDRIQIGEKLTGHYTLDPVGPEDTVVFLGTGTGEAPHNYMVWELLSRGHQGTIVSACCVRYARDLGYAEIHHRLMEQYPNYHYLGLTTREPGMTRKVYIQDLITSGELEEQMKKSLDPKSTHVFLCGNPKMIGVPVRDQATGEKGYPEPTGVIEILEQRGFQADVSAIKLKGNIHFEEYW